MFQPKIFREEDTTRLHALIRQYPFATIVSVPSGRLNADHLPLVLKAGANGLAALHGHVAAANPLARDQSGPMNVLAVFHGPAGYVSPDWYPSKREHGKAVPTWNYIVVHARGTLSFRRDRDWVLRHLEDLTRQHEARRSEPWTIGQMPDDFRARQLKALVGFEIEVKELQGVAKLSQNKSAEDILGVLEGLRSEPLHHSHALLDAMRLGNSQLLLDLAGGTSAK